MTSHTRGDPGATIHKHERPACLVTTTNVPDEDWIPVVADRGWLIVTRDRRIQDNLREIDVVREHRAKMVNLASQDAGSVWGQLELFFAQWRPISDLIDQPGPFIWIVNRTKMRQLDLDRK